MSPTNEERDALSLQEFCNRMGLGRTRAYEEIKAGRLRTVKCGSRRLVPVAECAAWLDRLAIQSK
jgi:excisionase family DNA binding protein